MTQKLLILSIRTKNYQMVLTCHPLSSVVRSHSRAIVPDLGRGSDLGLAPRPICRQVKLSIGPGDYVFGVSLGVIDMDIYQSIDELPQREIHRHILIRDAYPRVGVFSVRLPYGITEDSHWGICNLVGDCQVQVVDVSERD